MKKILIKENQRALLIRKGRISGVLNPGTYRLWDSMFVDYRVESFDIRTVEFRSEWEEVLIKFYPELIRKYFCVADVSDRQVGVLSIDGRLCRILEPGTREMFWNLLRKVEVEYIDISESYDIPVDRIQSLTKRIASSGQIHEHMVPESFIGLLYIDGKFVKELQPGNYAFWRGQNMVQTINIDMRLQTLEVAGQEIMTSDRVSLRLNFDANFKVIDPKAAIGELKNYSTYLYKAIQLSLRKHIGQKTLDEVLNEKDNMSGKIIDELAGELHALGIKIETAGVRDVILPGDMRALMNKVVEAEKSAQSNLIRRREEVAATRSLLNTAKMIEANPALMRLKEFEVLEKVSEKVQSIHVGGGIEQILSQLSSGGR